MKTEREIKRILAASLRTRQDFINVLTIVEEGGTCIVKFCWKRTCYHYIAVFKDNNYPVVYVEMDGLANG